jgi:hypothetical protein
MVLRERATAPMFPGCDGEANTEMRFNGKLSGRWFKLVSFVVYGRDYSHASIE